VLAARSLACWLWRLGSEGFCFAAELAMSSFDLDEVVSLSMKGDELFNKAHFERSLLKWRAALAAAEALGAQDCVLVARLKTEVARALYACEVARNGPFSQAFVLELLDLHAASAAILRRRRDAGTLLEGKCRPIEVQWRFKYMRGFGSRELAAQAKLIGYDAFLNVSCTCMKVLSTAMVYDSFEHGGEAEHSFLTFVCDLYDDAVALTVKSRVETSATAMEYCMQARLPPVLKALASQGHWVWHERVSRAEAHLRQSGVLEKRGLVSGVVAQTFAHLQEKKGRADRERVAAAAAGLLKSCALAGCGAKEAHVSHFGKCSACKAAVYCCRDHQQADWPAHKAACKAARKAAAAKDAA
jgi:hypothetical protein